MQGTHQVYELFVRGTPERIWQAIVDGGETAKYFFGTAFEGKLEPGARYRYAFANGAPAVDGEVVEARPGERLAVTWAIHYDPSCAGETTRVTWQLEPRGGNTKLTLIHDCQGAPNTARGVGNDGWSMVLSGLKSLVETGEGLAS